jgi:HD-GYP domain-containing protein (c-di-GMP phosphodiesterase class II)/DNA-binding response OmpR family regulator
VTDATTTVLVVDRNDADRHTFSEEFGGPATRFEFAATRGEAEAAFARQRPDIVVVDFADEALDGEGLVRMLRDDARGVDVPVIAVVDRERLERGTDFMEAGADFVALRPLEPRLTRARMVAALRQRELRQQVRGQIERFKILNEIGIALSAEHNTDRLIEKILMHAKHITRADGGTIYLMSEDERELRFAIMRTDSLDFALGGSTGKEIPFPPLPLYDPDTGEPNHRNIATHVALTGESVNIPDAYEAEGFDFSGTRAFDANTGYRSTSFLTIPMKNNADEVIGVLQLLNATEPKTRVVVPFSEEVQVVIESLASQAAVAFDNQQLLQGQRDLLDSFIRLIASAIDAKSPYTGGHCARVPLLTEMLADAACGSEAPPFNDFDLDDEQKYELMTAAWLHDCGKVTTPEYVVDKATKLETIYDRLHTVRTRAEVLRRDAEIAYLKALAEPGAQAERLRRELDSTLVEIDDDVAFIDKVNIGGEYLGDEAIERVKRIAGRRWRDSEGDEQPFLTENEVYNLSIRRGTLTPEEREAINNHIVMTIEMLEKLPFPKNLRNVPEFAGGHHERMDGKGYPRGLKRHEMSIPARIMAIADVFEALTARDRPYKSAMKLSVAMDILGKMKFEHHIDPDLFDLFVESKAYVRYADKFLMRDQIDEVDVSRYLGPMVGKSA